MPESQRLNRPVALSMCAVLFCFGLSSVSHALELRGFPVKLGSRVQGSSPLVADLDGDGQLEIALCTDRTLVVLDNRGAPLLGFPVVLAEAGEDSDVSNPNAPTFCRLGKDKVAAILAADPQQGLHAIQANGDERLGWPIKLGAQALSSASCLDLDGDGSDEILIATQDGALSTWTSEGQPYRGFASAKFKVASTTLGQVPLISQKPGSQLVIGAADGRLHVINRLGKELKGFPVRSSFALSAPAAAGDLDGDGQWDLIFGSQDYGLYAVNSKGESFAGFPVKTGYRLYGGVALGDVDGDRHLDIVVGGGDGLIYAINNQGKPLKGWPVKTKGRIYSTPAIADLNRDGSMEVLVSSSDGRLYIFNARGKKFPGYPVLVGGELRGSPQVADLDGNGSLEVLLSSVSGKLHAFTFVPSNKRPVAEIAWSGLGHGAQRWGRTTPNPGRFRDLAINPTAAKTGDTLKLSYRFTDLDGEAEGESRLRWFRNGRVVPELSGLREVPAEQTRKGERWFFTLQEAQDFAVYKTQKGAHITRSPELRIANTAPTPPEIAFASEQLKTRDSLRLKIIKPGGDADADKLHYKVRWIVDHAVLGALNGAYKVGPQRLKKGAVWEVVVTPSDGADDGEPTRRQIQVQNTPPSAPQVQLLPAKPKVTDKVQVRIVKPAVDPDGDTLTYQYAWSVDGQPRPLSLAQSEMRAGVARKGQKLQVVVRAFDGEDLGAPTQVEVLLSNSPPPAPKLAILPQPARTGDDLFVQVTPETADVDGDAVRYQLLWVRDGQTIAGASAAKLDAKETRRGQKIRAVALPSDGEKEGGKAFVEVQIVNTAPSVATLRVIPKAPLAGQALQAKRVKEATDPDGDKLRYHWSWLRDGALQQDLTSDTVPAGRIKKGQTWRAVVVADDGRERGEAGVYDVVVQDTPPRAAQVRLSPASPKTLDDLRVELVKPAVDVDGDKISYRYLWTCDGLAQDLAEGSDQVPAARTRRGQRWRVSVQALADGQLGAQAFAETEIVDSPPQAPQVRIVPARARSADALRVVVDALPEDADAEPLSLTFRWLKDGQETGQSGPVVDATMTRKGETWTVIAKASDGTLSSAEGRAERRIDNTPPRPPLLTLAKHRWRSDEDIVVQVKQPARDDDGEQPVLRWRWSRDGKAQSALDDKSELPHDLTRKGQRWTLQVIPADAKQEGEPAQLSLQIINTPPGMPKIQLEPTTPDTVQAIKVLRRQEASDIDGDRLLYHYRWFRDDQLQDFKAAADQVAAKWTHHGERWRVEVRAFDGEAEGPPVTAQVKIRNSLPEAPQVAITPSKAQVGTPLRCEIRKAAPDADADLLRYRFTWSRDGQPVNAGADGRIAGTLVLKGQRWQCSAQAQDAQGLGPKARSAELVVDNSPPGSPQVSIWPETPRADQALHCGLSLEASDPDGDPLGYDFTWTLMGRKKRRKAESHTGALLPAEHTRKGQRWRCRVQADDGSARGPQVAAQVTVRNTPPSVPVLRLEPTHPMAKVDSLRCVIEKESQDPDGDKVRYQVRWYKDGVLQRFASSNTEVAARLVTAQSLWQCEIVASDGSDKSPVVQSQSTLVDGLKETAVKPSR